MPTKEIDDAVNTPGAWGKIRKGSWLVAKYGFFAASLTAPFAMAIDPEGASKVINEFKDSNLGEKIMSGEVGLGGLTLEAGKILFTGIMPFSLDHLPDILRSSANTATAGANGLTSVLAP